MESEATSTSELIAKGLLAIGDGYRAKNTELARSGIPFARAGNIEGGFNFRDADLFPIADLNRVGNKVSQPGDVVFTSKGTVGRFAFVRPDTPRFVYSPQLCFWRSLNHDRVDPRWLYFWMQGSEFLDQISYLQNQTDMAAYVSLGDQRKLAISVPSIGRQREIADNLFALDDRIDHNRALAANLEDIARALFKSWFVDFDPVRAKVAGESQSGLAHDLADLFPDRFVESALGEIPEGWKVGSVEDLLVLQRGFDLPATQRTDGPFPVFSAGGLHGSHNTAMVTGPGVTTGRSGVIGNVYFVHEDFWPLNTSLWVKQFNAATPEYAYQYLRIIDLKGLGSGSAVPTLNRNAVHAQPAIIPPAELVAAYSGTASCLLNGVKVAEEQTRTLIAIRDLLLPRLISGKLRVEDAEAALEAA